MPDQETRASRAAGSPAAVPALAGLAALLQAVTGEDEAWARALAPGSRLEGDLALDSLELAALGALLRDRYGPTVSLPGYLATLEMDQLIGLTLADLLAYLDRCAGGRPAGAETG